MTLNFSPAPDYFICAEKVFSLGEEHVTRIYERSVLILMTDGVLRFLENGEEIVLKKGDYYIQRPMLLQEGLPLHNPPTYIYIEFNGTFSDDAAGLPLRGIFDEDRVIPVAKRLCEAAKNKSRNKFYLLSYMNRVFGELTAPSGNTGVGVAYLIRDHIESEYANDITLTSISKKFGYTEDYVNRLFKSEFSVTPHKHLINTRLDHALWLIEDTEIPIEKISAAVGYGDFSSFWRAFKSKYQFSPREIRKNQR